MSIYIYMYVCDNKVRSSYMHTCKAKSNVFYYLLKNNLYRVYVKNKPVNIYKF